MANQYVNKIIVGTEVKLDLSSDTIVASDLKKGATAHDKSGEPIVGTNEFDVNSQDATAAVAEILAGKTAYARGTKLTGTMPDNGAVTLEIGSLDDEPAIAMGFHDGSGKAAIKATEKQKIIAGNIKSGVSILGVTGSYGGEEIKAQANKAATPTFAEQVVTPDSGFDYLSQVTVAAIPVTYTDNAAGGQTLQIGG